MNFTEGPSSVPKETQSPAPLAFKRRSLSHFGRGMRRESSDSTGVDANANVGGALRNGSGCKQAGRFVITKH
jgi:hypothetical protein